jgi:prolyl oligopeptidase
MKPPRTLTAPVADLIHGVTITDNYRWLEGDNSDPRHMGAVTDQVAAWTDAQNAYTRARLDHLPRRREIEDALRPLMEIGAVTAPAVRGRRWFFSRREGNQNQPVHYWRDGSHGSDHVLIDPSVLDPTGLTTVEWLSPSHDGSRVAYGTYRAGDENTTLSVIDTDSGTLIDTPIVNKVQEADWLPDGSGFIYQNLADSADPYSGQVMFHRIGDPQASDQLLLRQFTREEDIVLATTWGPYGNLSFDGRWLWLGYWIDTQSIDAWLVNFEEFLATGKLTRRVVTTGEPGLITGTVTAGRLIMHTTKGARMGRVVSAPVDDPSISHWVDLVPERDDAVIEGVAHADGFMAVTYMKNASNFVEVFDLAGNSRGTVWQPGLGAISTTTEEDRATAYVTFASFNYPPTIFEVDLNSPSAAPEVWAQPAVPVSPSDLTVEQVWYASKDGTRVSMFLVHHRDLERTGDVPTIATGYGGFNISETPAFAPTWFHWCHAGGMIAIPNLRGGGEYGDAWHEAGMRDRKQNVFDDFQAALEWLIANGYTNYSRLAIAGGSNGGLLTGATITQRPDVCRAAIVAVPLLDMLRYQDFLMARYWVPEYGSAEAPDQFPYLLKYSPYHHVTGGTAYPAVLLTAGENDTRVHAMHARKMAAALQAATASNPDDRPILLWVDREAGHGQGKPLNLRLRDAVDQRIFLMWQLGMLDAVPRN